MKKIYVSDFTLKKLAGERKNPLLFREKTAIAAAIDAMGADAVELAPISSVKEDTVIYKTIASCVKNAALCLPVGSTADSVDTAWDAVGAAAKPCLQIELPVSTVQMEYVYHIKGPKMLIKIGELCAAAKAKCENVEFVALDATRAETEFVNEAIKSAVNSGATAVTVCDDAGVMLPEEFAEFIGKIKAETCVPVYVRVSDSMSMACACAFAAVNAGADGVKTVVIGKGELIADKFEAVIIAKGADYGVETGLDDTKIHTDIHRLTKTVNSTENEVVPSDNSRIEIFLDGESTQAQVAKACDLLGYSLSEEDTGRIFKALGRVFESKNSIGSRELEAMIATYAQQAPSTYHLDTYTAACSNVAAAMANVILLKNNRQISGMGTGDGPIDASFSAIEQAIGHHYELDDFQIKTVTEGKESLGSALIKLRSNGKLYSGNGISTDIVGATIRAYVNALNKIIFDEEE